MNKQKSTSQQTPSEMMLRRSFEPLLSQKDNKARLTFVGYQHSLIEWKKDGEKIAKPVLKLVFNVRDVTHDNPANIAITCDYRYNPNNRLGVTLDLMGCQIEEKSVTVDSDDEYGVKLQNLDTEAIFKFLKDCVGLVYKASLRTAQRTDKTTGFKKEAKGLWEIDFASIEPFMVKGEHKRDTSADELGNMVQSPVIDIDNESD